MAKSFFSRPEGKTGLVFILAALAGLGLMHNPILDYVRTQLSTLGGSVGMFSMLGLLVFVICDKRARNLIKYGFKWIMRKITSLFVELDPIKVLKKYVADLEKNFRELSENISKLRAQIAKIKEIMKQNNKEIAKSTRLIDEAKRQGRAEVVAVNFNQIGRLNKLNEKYALMVGRMDDLNNVLIKMHSYSSYKLTDTKNEIRMKEQEFAAISSGYSAMMNAKNIMNGNYQQTEIYESATEALTAELHTKIAEMDSFMQLSQPIFEEMDLQRAISQLEGEQMYQKIMTEGKAFLDKIDYNVE
ncbi:MAG: hypothetical protein MJZ61_04380 [Bacteroidales bacterium]|nr:hypothetical protein [Bacteroidales bacterium]